MPFTIDQFLEVFAAYSRAVYPAQFFLAAAALLAIFAAVNKRQKGEPLRRGDPGFSLVVDGTRLFDLRLSADPAFRIRIAGQFFNLGLSDLSRVLADWLGKIPVVYCSLVALRVYDPLHWRDCGVARIPSGLGAERFGPVKGLCHRRHLDT